MISIVSIMTSNIPDRSNHPNSYCRQAYWHYA